MSKLDRRNQNRQRQLEKQKEHRQETSIFSGRDGAPRNVAVIPLCGDCDAVAAVAALNASLDIDAAPGQGCNRVAVDRFKQSLQYFPVTMDLTASLDAARVADFVVVVLSAQEEVDDLGELILRSVEGQGLSTLFTTVHGLDKIEVAKQKTSVLESLKSYMRHFHPDQDKLYSLENRQECSNLMRLLCSTTPKGVTWRDERSWMLVEDIKFGAVEGEPTVLTGVVRGKGMKADRLVQVGDWGTFQVEKITAAPLAKRAKKQEGAMALDGENPEAVLQLPGEDRDILDDLAPEEADMDFVEDEVPVDATNTPPTSAKGVQLDDHHYFPDDDSHNPAAPKKLPKGTSAYQASWYLDDDISDSGSDLEDCEMAEAGESEDIDRPHEDFEMATDGQTELGTVDDMQAETVAEPDDDEDAGQLAAFRLKKRDDAQDDLQFPDEIELHPNVLARERLIRYRGLKDPRVSPWEEEADQPHEPAEWQRLLKIHDYRASRVTAAREAIAGGCAPGTRVSIYVKDVPSTIRESQDGCRPVTMFSLLRHEQKRTALNFLINLNSDQPRSIKSKEELIVQCGPRRFVVNALFSQGGNTPNDVHKYCRFLHTGQSAVATFMGPVTWGAVPTLFFRRKTSVAGGLPLALVGTGTAMAPSTSRVVAKRAILTGHPYHIHKKSGTIRYMGSKREDVEWFKALPLWTKRGRSGFVKESLGTHGYFKALFDGRINPKDTVGVNPYKRVWPRPSAPFQGSLLGGLPATGDQEETMDEDGA